MSRTILQVPMDPALRERAEKTAKEDGFSSLQEVVRIMLSQYSNNAFNIFATKSALEKTLLSKKAIKKFEKLSKDIDDEVNLVYPKNEKELFSTLEE